MKISHLQFPCPSLVEVFDVPKGKCDFDMLAFAIRTSVHHTDRKQRAIQFAERANIQLSPRMIHFLKRRFKINLDV